MKLSFLMSLIFVVACGKTKFSQTSPNSLESLAGGALNLQSCVGTNGKNISDNPELEPRFEFSSGFSDMEEEGILYAIAHGITAVPDEARDFYFGSGATIRVSQMTEGRCKNLSPEEKLVIDESVNGMSTCTTFEDSGFVLNFVFDSAKSVAELDSNSIQKNVVRVMGAYIDLNMEAFGPASKSQLKVAAVQISQNYILERKKLASVFSTEAKSPRLNLEAHQQALSTPQGRILFERQVFAESFDAYYCNSASLLEFKRSAPQTYAQFSILAAKLNSSMKGMYASQNFAAIKHDQPLAFNGIGSYVKKKAKKVSKKVKDVAGKAVGYGGKALGIAGSIVGGVGMMIPQVAGLAGGLGGVGGLGGLGGVLGSSGLGAMGGGTLAAVPSQVPIATTTGLQVNPQFANNYLDAMKNEK